MDGLLTYSYRGVVLKDVPGYRRLYVRVTFKGGPRNGKYAQSILNPHPGNRWLTGRLPFRAPPGTEALGVRLALTGGGEANFDATSLVCWAAPATEGAEPAAPGPKVRLVPASFLDNCYHLASGDPGTAIFGFDGEISAGEKCDLILQLPSGVALLALDPRAGILGVDKVSSATGERDQYRIDVGPWKKARNARFPFHQWGGLMVVLKTTLAPGDGPYPCPYWLEDDTGKHSRRVFDLRIVPPIEAAEAPKDFRSGGHWFLAQSIASEPAVSEVAALYRRVGFNSTHIPPCPLGDSLGKLGVERCTQPFTNAFTFPGEKPDDGVFRLADGSPLKQAICPSEVYLEGEYFTKKIKNGLFRRLLVTERKAEQFMINWEPAIYIGRGCFCDRCKAEFRTFSEVDASELQEDWPTNITRKHGDLWNRFRSWQNGRFMETLERTVHELGQEAGIDSHFIPEVVYSLLTDHREDHGLHAEYNTLDYAGKLPLIVSWAPYIWYLYTDGPYVYQRGRHLCVHTAARDVRSFLADNFPPEQRPELIAFPGATYHVATQPEAIAFEFITYFLNGYRGAYAYLFPGGYDARWWNALAAANRQIARFESFVNDGRPAEHHSLRLESPVPTVDLSAPDAQPVLKSPQWEKWVEQPLVLSWEYEKGNQRLIAVGNFWERAECFFRLSVSVPDKKASYVLREPLTDRVYSGPDGRVALHAKELREGVLLHVGAMRHAFFVVEPCDGKERDYGTTIRPEAVDAALKKRLPGIKALYRAESGDGGRSRL